jgi:hypothetical protein
VFLKAHPRRKDGKSHQYYSLVESVRTSRGPQHRVLAYLGELNASTETTWRKRSRSSTARDRKSSWSCCLAQGLFGLQILWVLGAPASGAALEDVAVMQEPVEHGRDGGGIAEQLAPISDGAV